MNRKGIAAVAAMALTATVTVAACSQTVTGTAERARPAVPDAGRSYGYIDNRCGMLLDETIGEVLGAQDVVRPYSGAVCQYVLLRNSQTVDAMFAWFDTGTLDRERVLAGQRGAQISDTIVERHPAFLAKHSVAGVSCSATAAANPGVLSWWVQLRGHDGGDPCADAQKLLSATLSSDM